ncbi:vWA domain-containing protein [Bacteroides faecalis]|nr:VWA domain-containing protein [Bacteroides faecalis]
MKTNQFRVFMFVLLMAVISLGEVSAQLIEVKGTVVDNKNNPLIGCNITVKGTKDGTITDIKGAYSIQVAKGGILCFSYIGYETVEVIVKSEEINVVMKESAKDVLEQVVVSGTGRQKKLTVTGALTSVRVEELRHAGLTNALAGGVGGVIGINSEEYKPINENGYKEVSDAPLSTFSIDVDAASYSNMRRFINRGELPPTDAVRTEELVNYFTYEYPKPTGDDPVKITIEAGDCPWNTTHRLVRIGLKAKEIPTDNLPASNLVFLIDVSGSMWGKERLDLVKSSLKMLVNNLRDKDKVAIVTYAGSADVKMESVSGSDKQKIREAIDELVARGSTAGGKGIQLAYSIAKKNFISNGNNRIILCSDGDFNVGVSSEKGLEQLIEKERKSGVFLTVLGYGMGNYKDSKIQTLAEKGNGNHAYIDNLQEANRVLVGEFGGTLHTVAKDVKLQVEFNPALVQTYRLIGYESRLLKDEDFNNDAKDAGDMGAGHTVTALYEVIPVGVKNDYVGKVDDLKYQEKEKTIVKPTGSNELLTVKLRYKSPDKDKSKKMDLPFVDPKGNNVSSDFKFASAVAMFGQLLRNSDFKGDATYDKVIDLAKQGLDNDEKGYRREFVRLVEAAKGLDTDN